jgi:hypothetical protein
MGADMRAQTARQEVRKAASAVDRADAEAWSIRMEGYGGPAQPSPTIGQCLNGVTAGWKLNAAGARHVRACLWMRSAGRVTRRSGSWSRRSDAGPALQATRPYDQVAEQREIAPYTWVHPDEDR